MDIVRIFYQRHSENVCSFRCGKFLRLKPSVIKALDVLFYVACRAAGRLGRGLPHHQVTLQIFLGNSIVHFESGRMSVATPSHKRVSARCHINIHHISGTAEHLSRFAFLPYYLAGIVVNQIESNVVDLIRKRITLLHVIGILETYLIIRVAITLVVVEQFIARCQRDCRCQQHYQKRLCRGNYVG